MKMYALKNVKVGYWNPPTFSPVNEDQVKIGFHRDILLNPVEAKKAHLDECELYLLGEFDDVRGIVTVLKDPVFLMDLKTEFVNG